MSWAIAVGDPADSRLRDLARAVAGDPDCWTVVAPGAAFTPSSMTHALTAAEGSCASP